MAAPQNRRASVTANRLNNLLHKANRLQLISDLVRTILRSWCVLVAAILLVLGVDALFALNAWQLVLLDVALLGLFVITASHWAVVAYRGRFDPCRTAIALEERTDIDDSRLINAIQLNTRDIKGQSATLRRHAVAAGDALANTLSCRSILDRPDLFKACRAAALALGTIGLAYLVFPGIFHAVLPRLLSPTADRPPYTSVRFSVSLEPSTPIFGRPVSIRATLSGPRLPYEANLVFFDDHLKPQQLPMSPQVSNETANPLGAGSNALSNNAAPAPGSEDYVLRIDRAEQSWDFFIDTPYGRSRRYRMNVLPIPQAERVQVTYTYPDYTGWNATEEPLGPMGIHALAGTQVSIAVTGNVALRSGLLLLTPEHLSPAVPQQQTSTMSKPTAVTLTTDGAADTAGHIVRGRFALAASGRYALSLVGIDDAASQQIPRGRVACVPDYPPEIHISQPAPHVITPENWAVDIAINVNDDVAIDRLVLHRGVNGWGPTPITVPLTGTKRTHMTAAYCFDLASLGAKAGDVITYFAIAYDNHSKGGQPAQTRTHAIQVVSEQEYFDYARTQYQLEDLLEEFADIEGQLRNLARQKQKILDELTSLQNRIDRSRALTNEQQQVMDDLKTQLDEFSDQSEALVQTMRDRSKQPDLYEFEDHYRQMLQQLADQLDQQAKAARHVASALSALSSNNSSPSNRGLNARGTSFAELDAPFNDLSRQNRRRTQGALEHYRLADAVMAQVERIRLVVELQQDLTKRMAQFRNRHRLTLFEQRTGNKFADEEAVLAQELQDVQDQLQQAASNAAPVLPGMSHGAMQICNRINRLQIHTDLLAAQQMARAGQGTGAHRAAASAAQKLNSLLSNCQSIGDSGPDELCAALDLPRFRAANALAQLSQGQRLLSMDQQSNPSTRFAGSKTHLAVLGPVNRASGMDRFTPRQWLGDRGAGSANSANDDRSSIEVLTPEVTTERGNRSSIMANVPLRYRQEAEAYFRRLAEDPR